ncbi:hypothetical protein [Mangrovivirga cuniculi]|uniref:Uncharacterized protein n=1 Tax=Mangrovivirga cuniculi TaxID=2715131 RepID=A0A4D7JD02_9BACT|nr:hypothetical protein [Mangrovivirga cuniculi]QCK14209.1 hypothetical protein DCC35_05345 [Mangrovivirga cuniculi]
MAQNTNIQSWPELAGGLYDKLTGRNAEITYDFKNFKIDVPTEVGSEEKTNWEFNGKLIISTKENDN